MGQSNFNKKSTALKKQPLVLYLISLVSFSLIFFRLFFLQVLNHQSYKKMSDQNRIRLIATQPIRGRIIDKNGFVLADSRLKYSLIVKPQYVSISEWQKNKYVISKLFNIDNAILQEKFLDGLKKQKLSITLLEDISVKQVIKFKENENNLFGFEIATKLIRNYPYKKIAAHLIGYTQPITDSEYQFLSDKGYKINKKETEQIKYKTSGCLFKELDF